MEDQPSVCVEAGTSLVCKSQNNHVYGVFGVASFGGYWERVKIKSLLMSCNEQRLDYS